MVPDQQTSNGGNQRFAELIIQSHNGLGHNQSFSSARFGKCLRLNGSVIPCYLKNKLKMDGGPVTVTDPEITRYFMTTIPEAVSFQFYNVLFSANGGESVCIRHGWGNPLKLVDLS